MNNWVDGVKIEMTAEEEAAQKAVYNSRAIASSVHKLNRIKEIRDGKLKQTDWWVLRGSITDAQKAKRQAWRDIPTNFTTESQYDELLVKDADTQKLTHDIWTID
jgi:hypothetical protein